MRKMLQPLPRQHVVDTFSDMNMYTDVMIDSEACR